MDVRPGDDPLLEQVLGERFRLLALIGRGGMGRVYRAVDLQTGGPVALKVLALSGGASDEAHRRFRAEVQASAQVHHPNVVRLLDSGLDAATGLAFAAMELLDGPNLEAVLKAHHTLDVAQACQLAGQVLAGVSAAHALGILHRDLKPANVMVVPAERPGEALVKVVDFGLAKLVGRADGPSTATGVVLGTVGYMSPEQAMGEALDPRTDVYSVGAMLYRLLSGRLPYPAQDDLRALLQALQTDPPPIPAIPPDLDRVVRWAMARDRQRRCASAAALHQALARWAAPTLRLPPTPADPPVAPSLPRLDLDLALPAPSQQRARTVNLRGSPAPHAAARATPVPRATPKPRTLSRRAAAAGLLATTTVGLTSAGFWVRGARRGWQAEVQHLLAASAFGVAESLTLDHAGELGNQPEVEALVREVLRGRRETEQALLEFRAEYTLRPSTWKGRVTEARSHRAQAFVLTIERVVGRACAGVLDWPDASVRAAVRGIHDGNQLVFTDYELVAGHLPGYVFNEKKAVFIDEPHMRGVDGPFRVPLEAELTSA